MELENEATGVHVYSRVRYGIIVCMAVLFPQSFSMNVSCLVWVWELFA